MELQSPLYSYSQFQICVEKVHNEDIRSYYTVLPTDLLLAGSDIDYAAAQAGYVARPPFFSFGWCCIFAFRAFLGFKK